jgi:ribosomal-protein-alanine N-acetyltransferase
MHIPKTEQAQEGVASVTDVPDRLSTDRLDVLPLTADALDALIRADRAPLEAFGNARFPDPLTAPPLMEDALPYIRDRLRAEPDDWGWWAWLIVARDAKEAVGILGLAGRPDADGAVVLGYTIYPAFEGRGYATEASQAIVAWALDQPSVSRVRATIPPGHTPSLRVADKLGMRQTGTDHDDDAGEVLVFEVSAGRSRRA